MVEDQKLNKDISEIHLLSQNNPEIALDYVDDLLSKMVEGGDKGETAADAIVELATNRPESVGVYFGRMVEIADKTNNAEIRKQILAASDAMRHTIPDKQIEQTADALFRIYDQGGDEERLLVSRLIPEIGRVTPDKLIERQDIIDEQLRATLTEATVAALRALGHLIGHDVSVVANFERELFLIAEETEVAVEAEAALSVLSSLLAHYEGMIDEERAVSLIQSMATGEKSYAGRVMQKATEQVGLLIVARPEYADDLLHTIVKNLNSGDRGVRKQAGRECLRVLSESPSLFQEQDNISGEYVYTRITELNAACDYEERVTDFHSLVSELKEVG